LQEKYHDQQCKPRGPLHHQLQQTTARESTSRSRRRNSLDASHRGDYCYPARRYLGSRREARVATGLTGPERLELDIRSRSFDRMRAVARELGTLVWSVGTHIWRRMNDDQEGQDQARRGGFAERSAISGTKTGRGAFISCWRQVALASIKSGTAGLQKYWTPEFKALDALRSLPRCLHVGHRVALRRPACPRLRCLLCPYYGHRTRATRPV
jgi:hypothetical protein